MDCLFTQEPWSNGQHNADQEECNDKGKCLYSGNPYIPRDLLYELCVCTNFLSVACALGRVLF